MRAYSELVVFGMLKKVLLSIVAVVAVVIVLGYLFRQPLGQAVFSQMIGPDHGFADQPPPTAPDYTNLDLWAAHPDKSDPSDDRPDGVSGNVERVSVFFVHPTTYINKASWNQPLDDADANWVVDERVLRHQASVFNGCCEVWAPRYRQATFFSFMDNGTDGEQALELAYQDVEKAFDAFLIEIGQDQPFILAGHSQGTSHGARLLRDRIAMSPLEVRMVAAYLIGFSISANNIGGLAVCNHATQTGCVIGWNAGVAAEGGLFPSKDPLICVNPLTWQANGDYSAHDLNLGGIGYPAYGRALPGEDFTAMNIELNVADATCRNGNLVIDDLRSESFPNRMPGGSLHVYDYSLFYLNLHKNAQQRVQTYLRNH